MMDIMGLSKRMFQHLGQMSSNSTKETSKVAYQGNESRQTAPVQLQGSLSQRLQQVAAEYDVSALNISEVLPLQSRLVESGLIQANQVRAQGLITQMAYKHQSMGPMNLEAALEDHIGELAQRSSVLADHKESKHLLNVVRNLISARQEQNNAA